MALIEQLKDSAILQPRSAPAMRHGSRNDAFSFWKLPEAWRNTLAAEIAESETVAENFLFERYLPETQRRPPPNLRAYYPIKRVIPPTLRHLLNSMAVGVRRHSMFPNWPCESALIEFWRTWMQRCLTITGVKDAWHLGFWPANFDCCVVLTHDVESPAGFDRMEAMADVEERLGFRSAWNLPLAQYPIDWKRVEQLQARHFEFGAHGLSHDGRLFRSEKDFAVLAPLLNRLAQEHGLRGFRGPSTLRRAEWIDTLDIDHDSTFSDTDPFEPQPGGTCSVFPFFLGRVVELPYSLPQDHTLTHILHRNALQIWTAKAQWIASVGGMILVLTHPDYSGFEPFLGEYEELLKRLRMLGSVWYALPSEVAAWWRQRAQMKLLVNNDEYVITGNEASRACARRLSDEPLARWD